MKYPKTIQTLIESFEKYPGVGKKTAERFALATLNMEAENLELFAKTLIDSKTKIKRCIICNNYTENDKCDVCLDTSRDQKIICLVEQPKNIIMIEKTNVYNGQYHVIDKLISPLDGINPEDINLATLKERIKKNKIEEVIIALKQNIEGETTTLYLMKILEKTGLKISKMAQGIPHGVDMDYIDIVTLEKALEERKNFINKSLNS